MTVSIRSAGRLSTPAGRAVRTGQESGSGRVRDRGPGGSGIAVDERVGQPGIDVARLMHAELHERLGPEDALDGPQTLGEQPPQIVVVTADDVTVQIGRAGLRQA